MIVVARSTSTSPRTKRSMRPSIRSLSICPWIARDARLGHELARADAPRRAARGCGCCTTKTCPPAVDLAAHRLARSPRRSRAPPSVSMACRPSGGVVRFEMSRMPSSAMCSVRGIGVAESVRTSTWCAHRLQALLLLHAEALLLVDDDQAEVRERDVLAEQPVRADDDVDRAVGQSGQRSLVLPRRVEARTAVGPGSGRARSRCVKVRTCCSASTFVGTRTADLPPGADDLEERPQRHLGLAVADVAAQQAVHRLRRSRGRRRTAARRGRPGRACRGTGRPSTNSRCQSASGGKGGVCALQAGGLGRPAAPRARSSTAAATFCLRFPHSVPPSFESRGARPVPDVALDEVDARDGHVDAPCPRRTRRAGTRRARPCPRASRGPRKIPMPWWRCTTGAPTSSSRKSWMGRPRGAAARQAALAQRQVREVVVGDVRRPRRPEAERPAEAPAAEGDLGRRASCSAKSSRRRSSSPGARQ